MQKYFTFSMLSKAGITAVSHAFDLEQSVGWFWPSGPV